MVTMGLFLHRFSATLVYASSVAYAVRLSTFDDRTEPYITSLDVDPHDSPYTSKFRYRLG